MPTIQIITTYDSVTRELASVATLTGFVEGLPDRVVTGEQHDSITLVGEDKLTAADTAAIQRSFTRALNGANQELVEFEMANETSDKGDEIIEAGSDPVGVFDDVLIPPPEPTP